jgi:hypothetical protein
MTRPSFLPPPRDREPEPSGFEGPGPEDRVTIVGMTGSGKSTFGMWLFAEYADFQRKPWVFIDYKREALINVALSEKMMKPLKMGSQLPDVAGIWVIHAESGQGPDPMNDFLMRIYNQGNIGVVVDETTMIPNTRGDGNTGGPYQTLLSQGRSKIIPVWSLSQRPAFINRMAFTENNYFCAFRLKSEDDNDKIMKEIPKRSKNYDLVWDEDNYYPRGHESRWYDANRDINFKLKPCPPPEEILKILGERVDAAKKKEKL